MRDISEIVRRHLASLATELFRKTITYVEINDGN